MEVLRGTFEDALPEFKTAIHECDFIAIDAEFTGLDPHGIATPRSESDTLQGRFIKVRQQAVDFIVCQFGICTFRWNAERESYEAKPFNVYLMPAASGTRGAQDRWFQCQASTMDFLTRNGFDFTKWLGYGVHFMNWEEESILRRRREQEITNSLPDIQLDDRGIAFENEVRNKIDAWYKECKAEKPVYINCVNGYQYRIVYQFVRNHHPNLDAVGQSGAVRVWKKNQDAIDKRNAQRRVRSEADIAHAVGFRRVIDMIAQSRKPVVGHHMIMDVCQVYQHMYKTLPDEVGTFAGGLLALFPIMFDTKLLAEVEPMIESMFSDTRLDDMILNGSWPQQIQKIPIETNMYFTRYMDTTRQHEAGYDALCTGTIFIRIYHMLAQLQNQAASPTSPTSPTSPGSDGSREGIGGAQINFGSNRRGSKKKSGRGRHQSVRSPPTEAPKWGPIFANGVVPPVLKEYANQLFFVKSPRKAYNLMAIRESDPNVQVQNEAKRFHDYLCTEPPARTVLLPNATL
ncbi:ribonuclease H-like domain-containing protein [Thamnocephalis sphaerospora]|uniref:Ribonuclease H-like domain-containing protein n=1 Tax=Thamnocephalis sphaerospora TaxID=78915 RepID=A0A4P9XIQ7_9FUNG|nr:ribonuclease H-like domain-containing protein [Thamnocephalis sphaerospora]|eukprot:RKP05605.1 ribonuclease H-like domain-containing protein [Thamnocephalis sphaerospora]